MSGSIRGQALASEFAVAATTLQGAAASAVTQGAPVAPVRPDTSPEIGGGALR